MRPSRLTNASFASYPAAGARIAATHLPLLRGLPLVLAAVLLRELIVYDWKFPAERREFDAQLGWLAALPDATRAQTVSGFDLPIEPSLAESDWVANPFGFMEKLTAWMWSTHRMDSFRETAEAYATAARAASPEVEPTMPRLGMVAIGAGTRQSDAPLFRKLKPHGVHLTRVVPDGAMEALVAETTRRAAAATPGDFRHWYIDGGTSPAPPHLTHVSYGHLEQPRAKLLDRIQRMVDAGNTGPEELRSLLARLHPAEIGLSGDQVLDRFQMSLLTEGAGAQIFATTFVQWSARECVRRAQPETLLVRYAPRQRAQAMNAMLKGAAVSEMDTAGSLVDADMGAFYTWLNLRRLSGAENLRFLAWYEDHREAVAIGPGLPRGTASDSNMTMAQVLKLLA